MRCILHIGPPKTGSSSIQFFLRENRAALDDAGFFIPKTQRLNMAELQLLLAVGELKSRTGGRLGVTAENFGSMRVRLITDLSAQLKGAKQAGYHTVVFSNEGSGTAKDAVKVAELRDMLLEHCDDVTVVPVLRRPDLRAVSHYKNRMKNRRFIEQDALYDFPSHSPEKILRLWSGVFGEEKISPLLLPDSVPEKRDLIADFCAVAGVKNIYMPADASRYHTNTTLDGRALEVYRQLNIHFTDRAPGKIPFGQKILEEKLEEMFPPPIQKVKAARADAKALVEKHAEGLEYIRKTWFPERETLFSDDFSKWPEKAVYPEPTKEDLYKLIGSLAFDKRLRKSPSAVRAAVMKKASKAQK